MIGSTAPIASTVPSPISPPEADLEPPPAGEPGIAVPGSPSGASVSAGWPSLDAPFAGGLALVALLVTAGLLAMLAQRSLRRLPFPRNQNLTDNLLRRT